MKNPIEITIAGTWIASCAVVTDYKIPQKDGTGMEVSLSIEARSELQIFT
jgi:hypothetical protein